MSCFNQSQITQLDAPQCCSIKDSMSQTAPTPATWPLRSSRSATIPRGIGSLEQSDRKRLFVHLPGTHEQTTVCLVCLVCLVRSINHRVCSLFAFWLLKTAATKSVIDFGSSAFRTDLIPESSPKGNEFFPPQSLMLACHLPDKKLVM